MFLKFDFRFTSFYTFARFLYTLLKHNEVFSFNIMEIILNIFCSKTIFFFKTAILFSTFSGFQFYLFVFKFNMHVFVSFIFLLYFHLLLIALCTSLLYLLLYLHKLYDTIYLFCKFFFYFPIFFFYAGEVMNGCMYFMKKTNFPPTFPSNAL